MSKSKTRTIPRPFSLHWGSGLIVEEATFLSEYHEPALQLLEFDEGYLSVRLCYYDLEGRFQRSPLILSDVDIEGLRHSLKNAPRLKKLLQRLLGNEPLSKPKAAGKPAKKPLR